MNYESPLDSLSRAQLEKLVIDMSKNVIAMDGVWFQSLELEQGMDVAMRQDRQAARSFAIAEARRIKHWLELSEHPGLLGLSKALLYKHNSLCNKVEIRLDDNEGSLHFRIVDCRVQIARVRKGLSLHPCKSAGEKEYAAFAQTIDDRIVCVCESCYPDVTDDTCACSWRFTVKE